MYLGQTELHEEDTSLLGPDLWPLPESFVGFTTWVVHYLPLEFKLGIINWIHGFKMADKVSFLHQ